MCVGIRSGNLNYGVNCTFGNNVIIDVAEEVTIGDRCVIPDNTYFGGRRVTIGNDFYGYSWEWRRLDIGRGRRDDENAILTVGDRCTFHDNKIDLAERVTIGNDVGLSPEVAIYTHYYWMSPFDGFPLAYNLVSISDRVIVGFRSVILPEVFIAEGVVIGAQSVVSGSINQRNTIYVGNPAKAVKYIAPSTELNRVILFSDLVTAYKKSLAYRGISPELTHSYPLISAEGWTIDILLCSIQGEETPLSDDCREFLFKHGIRIYTKRPFRKLPKR